MTRQEIRTLSRKMLGETTAAFWTDSQLNEWIDDAGNDIAFLTKCLRTNSTITITGGTGEYTISSAIATNVLSIIDVWYRVGGATWTKMDLMAREELDTRYPTWRSVAAGVPSISYYDIEEDVIGFYVSPQAINYTSDTIAFVASTDTITDSASAFVTEGFAANQSITVTDTVSNDDTYSVSSVTAGVITIAGSLTNESAGSQFTITTDLSAKVYYATKFTDLSAEGSVPALPLFLHKTMAIFVAARGFESRGYGDKANDQWTKYKNQIVSYQRQRMIDKDHRESSEVLYGKKELVEGGSNG